MFPQINELLLLTIIIRNKKFVMTGVNLGHANLTRTAFKLLWRAYTPK